MKDNHIAKAYETMKPSYGAKQRVWSKITEAGHSERNKRRRPGLRGGGRLLVAAMVLLLVSTVALAVQLTGGWQTFLDRVNPAFVAHVTPMGVSAVQDGIEMEVVALGTYHNSFRAYFVLQDLAGSRIDRTTEVVILVDLYENGVRLAYPLTNVVLEAQRHFEDGKLTLLGSGNWGYDIAGLENPTARFELVEIRNDVRWFFDEHIRRHYGFPEVWPQDEQGTVTNIFRDDLHFKVSEIINPAPSEWNGLLTPDEAVWHFPELETTYISNIGITQEGQLRVQTIDPDFSLASWGLTGWVRLFDGAGNEIEAMDVKGAALPGTAFAHERRSPHQYLLG